MRPLWLRRPTDLDINCGGAFFATGSVEGVAAGAEGYILAAHLEASGEVHIQAALLAADVVFLLITVGNIVVMSVTCGA